MSNLNYDITVIAPGKLKFEYGPVSMEMSAWKDTQPLDRLLYEACEYTAGCLNELSGQLVLLKMSWQKTDASDFHGIAKSMWQAVKKTGDETLTPMAAVAGAISDCTAEFLTDAGATKVIADNGGDIALRLCREDTIKLGITSSVISDVISGVLEIKGTDGIFGVCTSGLGGRSFTRGIADSVTVLASSCAVADAYATFLANRTYIASTAVKREKAGDLDPLSDIAGLEITAEVGNLSPAEKEQGSEQLKAAAQAAISSGNIKAVYCYIQGMETIVTCII